MMDYGSYPSHYEWHQANTFENLCQQLTDWVIDADEARNIIRQLRRVDWYEIICARDDKRAEEHQTYLNSLHPCSRCGREFKRKDLGYPQYGSCRFHPMCKDCLISEQEDYERMCPLCGTIFYVPKRDMRQDTICPECLVTKDTEYIISQLQTVSLHNSRARREGLPATLTLRQWHQALKDFKGLCAYCRKEYGSVLEHFIPVSKGGGTTVDNCVPACASCNSSKGSRHPDDITYGVPNIDKVRNYLQRKKALQTANLDMNGLPLFAEIQDR